METKEATLYHCPVCDEDIKNVYNARQSQVQCPHCNHVDDLKYFFANRETKEI